MKIFVLLSRVPYPLEKGDKVRAYHQIKELSKHHDVHLCCLSDTNVHPNEIAHLESIVHKITVIPLSKWRQWMQLALALFSKLPFQVAYFKQQPAQSLVETLLNEFKPDHILCQMVRTADYVKTNFHVNKTLDYQDALSSGYERRSKTGHWLLRGLFKMEAERLKRYEQIIFDYFDYHWIISEQDRQLIQHSERQKMFIVPNGVDSDLFFPDRSPKIYDVVFAGNMAYAPNIDCAQRLVNEIWPLIKFHLPDARLLIAGAQPTKEVLSLASEQNQIVVSGWMDDIRVAYRSSKILLAPMNIGTGMQNKILEAWSCGVPCITSTLVAGGFGKQSQTPLLVADSNESFANMCAQLIKDENQLLQMSLKCRQFVIDQYTWHPTMENWLQTVTKKKDH
jgi:polysaccharide biosynthesis protein PslH